MDKLLKHPFLLLRFVLALCYIGLGAFIFVKPALFENASLQKGFAALLIVYGGFRLYRGMVEYKNLPDA